MSKAATTKTKFVGFRLPIWLLSNVDELCSAHGINRTDFVKNAIHERLLKNDIQDHGIDAAPTPASCVEEIPEAEQEPPISLGEEMGGAVNERWDFNIMKVFNKRRGGW